MSDEDYMKLHRVVEAKLLIYQVNKLDQDVDMNIIYQIDDDYKNNPQFRQNRAQLLQAKGMLSRADFMKELDVPNSEELLKRADDENQALTLAKQIASNPELMQKFEEYLKSGTASKPSESIPFDKLPPTGKIQMAAQAGIKLTPEDVGIQHILENADLSQPANGQSIQQPTQ